MNVERFFQIVNLLLPSGMSLYARLQKQSGEVISERTLYARTDADFQTVIDQDPTPGGNTP